MTRPRANNQAGFTLIEVMVAALIIVIAFTSLAVVFIGGQNQSSATVEESQLINVADQQIEQIRAAVNAGSFDALGSDTVPSADSTWSAARSTYANPNNFEFSSSSSATAIANGTGPTACYDINANYDNVGATGTQVSASTLGNEVPSGFQPWSYCGSYGEPLVAPLTGSPLVHESTTSGGIAVKACPLTASGAAVTAGAKIYSPCYVNEGSNVYFNVYTFVTDTYGECGTQTNSSTSCPSLNSSSQVSGCTFPTSTSASTPCSDARRVTVAVYPAQAHQQLGRATPVYISSIMTNPAPTSNQGGSPVGLTLGVGL